jgi:hypothetical protein
VAGTEKALPATGFFFPLGVQAKKSLQDDFFGVIGRGAAPDLALDEEAAEFASAFHGVRYLTQEGTGILLTKRRFSLHR